MTSVDVSNGDQPADAPTSVGDRRRDTAEVAVDTRLPSIVTAATRSRVITITAFLLVALFVLPAVLGAFWTKIALEMGAYSMVTLGLGLLVGRVGIYSLCQIPLVAAGAWFSLRVHYLFDESLPFPLILIAAGVLTGLLGVVIGLPALRLSGLYLALVTLMAAGAITLLLINVKFPNGGGGFWGFDTRSASGFNSIPRPGIAKSDDAYFRYTVVVAAIMFFIAAWQIMGKPGRAWAALRQAEVTAISAGVNTTLYKLWAFALSAAIAGVAGGVIVASSGVTTNQFPVEQSIILLAVVLLGGAYNLWGAIVAAFFLRVLPQILDQQFDAAVELLTILFGIGVMQVLIVQPKGVVEDLHNLGIAVRHSIDPAPPTPLSASLDETDVIPRRLAAFAIDAAPVALMWWLAGRSDSFTFQLVLTLLTYFLVRLLPTVASGRSLGKSRLGLAVVSPDGQRPGWIKAIVRDIALVIDVAVIGLVLIVLTPQHRRIGDILGGTLVVAPDPTLPTVADEGLPS